MRNEGNIERLRKLLWQLEEQKLQDKKNYSPGIYSNMNLAFHKLHALRCLERLYTGNKSFRYDFIKDFFSLCDFNTSIQHAYNILKNRLSKIFVEYEVAHVFARVGYRFITGMGYPSPVENGMLFHHVYGVPYIHGESVKGLVRYVYLLDKFPEIFEKPKEFKNRIEKLEEGEYREDKKLQEEYSLIFGNKKCEGSIIFFDAYPTKLTKDNLAIDIMNPHYGEYYRNKGQKPAVEWDKPNPIFFLTLEDVEFCFTVGFDPLRLDEREGKEKLEKVVSCLKGGLEMFGLGGKRRKGYGWFSVKER